MLEFGRVIIAFAEYAPRRSQALGKGVKVLALRAVSESLESSEYPLL